MGVMIDLHEAVRLRQEGCRLLRHPPFFDTWFQRLQEHRPLTAEMTAAFSFEDWRTILHHFCLTPFFSGDLFYSLPEIQRMLSDVSKAIPITTLTRDLVPSAAGIWIYSEPEVHDDVADGDMYSGRAGFGWVCQPDALMLLGLDSVPTVAGATAAAVIPVNLLSWRFDRDIPPPDPSLSDEDKRSVESQMRFWLAAFLFIRQKILDLHPMRSNRPARRQAERLGIPASDIRVVCLRRKIHDSIDSEHRSLEWSCHFLVKGHWRAQYYPSRRVHEPIYILPYLKGDFDKPFKPPTETVFAVVR